MTDRLTTEEIRFLRERFTSWRFTSSEEAPVLTVWLGEATKAVQEQMLSLLDELLEHREREAAEIAVANALAITERTGLFRDAKWTEANPQRPPVIDVRMPMPKETDR